MQPVHRYLVPLCALGLIFGYGCQKEEEKVEPETVTESEEKEEVVEAEEVAEEDELEEEEPTEVTLLQIGDEVETEEAHFILNSIHWEEGDDEKAPPEGKRWLAVNATYKNKTESHVMFGSLVHLELFGEEDKTYSVVQPSDGMKGFGGAVPPGESVTGYGGFVVDEDDTGWVLKVKLPGEPEMADDEQKVNYELKSEDIKPKEEIEKPAIAKPTPTVQPKIRPQPMPRSKGTTEKARPAGGMKKLKGLPTGSFKGRGTPTPKSN